MGYGTGKSQVFIDPLVRDEHVRDALRELRQLLDAKAALVPIEPIAPVVSIRRHAATPSDPQLRVARRHRAAARARERVPYGLRAPL